MELLRIWDQNKRTINDHLKAILKFPLKDDYNIIVLHPVMDTVLMEKGSINIGWGNRRDLVDPSFTLTNIVYNIVKSELSGVKKDYKEIIDVVLELAIQNELYTRLSGKSSYLNGDSTLVYLKRQIYPYWLMYLGCDKDDFPRYMMRDGIVFEIDKYLVEKDLKKLNLYQFIEFCIRNQKKIIRINKLEII
jgi:hypothetical protein